MASTNIIYPATIVPTTGRRNAVLMFLMGLGLLLPVGFTPTLADISHPRKRRPVFSTLRADCSADPSWARRVCGLRRLTAKNSKNRLATSCPIPSLAPSSSTVDNYHQRHQARRSVIQILPSEVSARRSKREPRLVVLRLLRLWPLLLLTPIGEHEPRIDQRCPAH